MNDITLSSLLNLFALAGAERKLSKDESVRQVSKYLKYCFGVRNYDSYLNLYSDLRDFYDDAPELEPALIVEGICSKLHDRIHVWDQKALVLRLMEFCASDGQVPSVVKTVASKLTVSDHQYQSFLDYVTGKSGEEIREIELPGDCGVIRTLWINDFRILVFTYFGDKVVLMNDVPVHSGVYQEWMQSGVLKSRFFAPYFHSTIMDLYGNEQSTGTIDLCGRDINFRFDPGSDIGMHNFSFNLRSGELVAIMGGSGVGKSTLLSLLNGTLRPQEGGITINGHDIASPEAKALIGYVPQDDLLIEELTVYQNLWYTAKLCFSTLDDQTLDSKVMSVLVQLGLDAAKDLKVGSPINKYISGGQRKRLNIALELIREPSVLFLDEPTSGLSSTDTEKVVTLLKEQTCKGRLIVVNIHQPSSDVYKLFDRLWLLDKGGYPVFDGNPIEAVTYFKTAANYADAQTSTCPTCGNVNPEIVLNIIDEKALDTSGNLTENRKVTPQEWHGLYLENRAEMRGPELKPVPSTDQKRPGIFKQIIIFLQRNIKAKITNLQYILVTLLEAPLLAAICALLTHFIPASGTYTVMDNKNLVSYYFMAVIVSIFLGMSGSAEEIIKDRALLKREKFLNLSYFSYISSKIIYMAAVCLLQTLFFVVTGNLIAGIHGMFWIWWIILFASAFLSSLIGLLLSQCMNSVVAIYITIPILLIPQILLCGLVVRFEDLDSKSETGNVPVIGDVIPSRWAFEALAVASYSENAFERNFYQLDREHYSCLYHKVGLLHELESQLEIRQSEIETADRQENPKRLGILQKNLPTLTAFCRMDAYSGDWDYESLNAYLKEAGRILDKRLNVATIATDRRVSEMVRELGKEAVMELKRSNYNLQLDNLVNNTGALEYAVVRGESIVPCGFIISLTPESRCGRAPFYSGVKRLGNRIIPTPVFNLFVMLIICLLLSLCLYLDVPGRYVRKARE